MALACRRKRMGRKGRPGRPEHLQMDPNSTTSLLTKACQTAAQEDQDDDSFVLLCHIPQAMAVEQPAKDRVDRPPFLENVPTFKWH